MTSPVLILYSMRVFNNVSVLENVNRGGGGNETMYSSHVRRISSPASVEQDAERDGDLKVGDHRRAEAGIEEPLRNGAGQTKTRQHISRGGLRTHIRSVSAYCVNLNLRLDEFTAMRVGGNEGR